VLNGTPVQHVDEVSCETPQLLITDLSRLSPSEQTERVRGAAREAAHEGCDMARGPLFDLRLLELSEGEHVFILSAHHIIADAFAFTLVLREIWLMYREFCRERPSPLRYPATQYADYVAWQGRTLTSMSARIELYWRERLAGATGIRWPIDLCEAGVPKSGPYEHVPISFGRKLSARLRELATATGTTLAMCVLAVYVAYLSRWCRQEEFVLAMSVTGRDRPELERMAGYCAYALFLRVQVQGETLLSLIRNVSEEFQRALAHGDFGRAVAGNPESHSAALFQWASWPLDEPGRIVADLGLQTQWLPMDIETDKEDGFSQYDLQLALWEADEAIGGWVHCRAAALSAVQGLVLALPAAAEELTENAHRPLRSRVG
jgi:Condensation domain